MNRIKQMFWHWIIFGDWDARVIESAESRWMKTFTLFFLALAVVVFGPAILHTMSDAAGIILSSKAFTILLLAIIIIAGVLFGRLVWSHCQKEMDGFLKDRSED